MHIYAPSRRLISDREVKSAAGAREEEDLAALRVHERERAAASTATQGAAVTVTSEHQRRNYVIRFQN